VSAFGGVNAVKAASRDELMAVSWLPDTVADAVWTALHGEDDDS